MIYHLVECALNLSRHEECMTRCVTAMSSGENNGHL